MKRLAVSICITAALGFASLAQAQATRTWVSGVGDDANPCSRTAPCKTFQGAISKTAANGEINVIDPGGFGAVTITKSIKIDGTPFMASVLNAGSQGITINAGVNDVVTLRGLSINGAGTGFNGVRILAAKRVVVENCEIFNQTQRGISIETVANMSLFIRNTSIRNNTSHGIGSFPTGGAVTITGDNVAITGNGGNGIDCGNSSSVTMSHSTLSQNINAGIILEQQSSTAEFESCTISSNNWGLFTNNGSGANPKIVLSRCLVTKNTTLGVNTAGGGTVVGYSNNTIVDNGGLVPGNSVSSSVAQQ
jgi:hypothetical protein